MWGHNKERGRRGENLFAITEEGLDVPLAMEEWHHEREHYNLSAASCDRGQMCGHYTQVRGRRGGGATGRWAGLHGGWAGPREQGEGRGRGRGRLYPSGLGARGAPTLSPRAPS